MKLSSAFVLSAITVAALGESITTTITATKNGHTSSAAKTSSVVRTFSSTTTENSSNSKFTSAVVASTTTFSQSSATIVTPTRTGQAYTESSSRDAQSVRTHESNNWSSSSSASTKMVSSITRVQTTTAGIFTNGKSSTTPQIVNYTGAADSIAAGTGLMGAALAAVIFL
ncbi:BDN_1c_G0013540.mRNA.1.CDS.1 [Saccharomyces cerevisiae]|nr:BDN_1c_G0013540.mRNA.1.CDS.1 [Saccharomyces cerevisiae]CAI7088009.1 BDN_1c_G0013540.mRNA.1.CDS.1 [Saccharomyces cerevisiae]